MTYLFLFDAVVSYFDNFTQESVFTTYRVQNDCAHIVEMINNENYCLNRYLSFLISHISDILY